MTVLGNRSQASGTVRGCGIQYPVGFGPLDVVLELAAELADRVLDRPGGAVGQAADRGAGHDADRSRRSPAAGPGPSAARGRP